MDSWAANGSVGAATLQPDTRWVAQRSEGVGLLPRESQQEPLYDDLNGGVRVVRGEDEV